VGARRSESGEAVGVSKEKVHECVAEVAEPFARASNRDFPSGVEKKTTVAARRHRGLRSSSAVTNFGISMGHDRLL